MLNSNSNAITSKNDSSKEEVTIMSNISTFKHAITSHVSVRGLAALGGAALVVSAALGIGSSAQADGFEFSPEWRAHVEQDAYEEQARTLAVHKEIEAYIEADLLAAYQGNLVYGAPLGVGSQPMNRSAALQAAGETAPDVSATFTEADLLAAHQGNVTYGTSTSSSAAASPVQLSPEWAIHVETDALELVGRPFHAVSQTQALSSEWAALTEREVIDDYGRVANAFGQPQVLSSEWLAFLEHEPLITGYQRPANAIGQ